MDHYNRPSTAAVTVDPYVLSTFLSHPFTLPNPTPKQSTFASQAAYDQLHCDISGSPTDDYWCQTCISPYSECLCYATSPVSPHHGYSHFGTAASKNYTFAQAPYHKYQPSNASSTSSYYTTSSTASQPQQASYSTIAPNTGEVKGTGYSRHVETSSKRGKRKGSMPPEEAREKRLEQNRRSQRSFRDRQARLVIDLKHKVDMLTEENQKLAGELSALGLRSPSRDSASKSPGTDYSTNSNSSSGSNY